MAKDSAAKSDLASTIKSAGATATISTARGTAELNTPEGEKLLQDSISDTFARAERDGRLFLHSELSRSTMAILRLAVESYAKKCAAVAKSLKEIGASDLQVTSLQNLVIAGHLAIANAPEGVVPQLGTMTYPQRDAVRNALAWLHSEYEKLMEKEGTLLADTEGTARNLDIVQAMYAALMPQRELSDNS